MCIEERIPGTSLYRAQQIYYPSINGLEPASVLSGDASKVVVKLHSTFETFTVTPSSIVSLPPSLKAGDVVQRVMFSGLEEAATVISVDSATHATIKLASGTRATYSTPIFRLRKVSAAPKNGFVRMTTPATPKAAPAPALDVPALKRVLESKLGPSAVKRIVENPHMPPGSTRHAKFAEVAVSRADSHEVDIFLHGSSECNVDSICKQSLLASRSRHGAAFWLTEHLQTAQGYMHGASRVVAFAVLKPKGVPQPIITVNDPEHILPLFVVHV